MKRMGSGTHVFRVMFSAVKQFARYVVQLPLLIAFYYSRLLERFRSGLGYRVADNFCRRLDGNWQEAWHEGIPLRFLTPNSVCDFRARTFATKEPETLEWIDRLGGGVLYDVGANVGLYSIYYAKRHDALVYAFEPSPFNLVVLSRNIDMNEVSNRVVVVPVALTSCEETSRFRMTSIEVGGALSSFGENVGFDGKPLDPVLEFLTIGASLDFLRGARLIPDPPSLLKIDVDGIEELVLQGAYETLRAPSLKSVLIEVNTGVPRLASPIEGCLREHGFLLEDARIAEMFSDGPYANVRNQIWIHPDRTS